MTTVEHPVDEAGFEELSVKELKALAKDEGVVLTWKTRSKAKIIVALLEHFATNGQDDGAKEPEETEAAIDEDALAEGTIDAPTEEEAPVEAETVTGPDLPGPGNKDEALMSLYKRSGLTAVLSSGGFVAIPEQTEGVFRPRELAFLRRRANAGFHLGQAIFFKRLDDGSVQIHKDQAAAQVMGDGTPRFDFNIDPESWKTVIEVMSTDA